MASGFCYDGGLWYVYANVLRGYGLVMGWLMGFDRQGDRSLDTLYDTTGISALVTLCMEIVVSVSSLMWNTV